MSNNLKLNPILLDTFSATATLRDKGVGPLTVTKIVFKSAAIGDTFALEDEDGNQIVIIGQDEKLTSTLDFGPAGFAFLNGIVFDHDDAVQSGLGSGDFVLIYLR